MSASPAIARPGPVPAKAGIGLRAQHHRAILDSHPAVGWLEAHSENYFAPGGAQPRFLERLRADYPLSLHGVGLSLGSVDALDPEHLAHLKRIVQRFEPALVSEHLSWGAIHGTHFNDLLPLPYTHEALAHLIARVTQVQEFLSRPILVENVSSYLQFTGAEMTEWDFLAALARESGCGLLLDVNNVYVNAHNHGLDAHAYIDALPIGAVHEIHLAGHARNPVDGRDILIDTHGSRVCEEVWSLYETAVRRFGDVPALVEWDTDIPELEVLVAEAARADAVKERARALAA